MFAILLSEGMNPFYENVSSFPTIVFTFFLIVTVLYWVVAVLGLVDLDILDFDIPGAEDGFDINQGNDISNPDVLAGIMLRFGLYGVPVTIIISLLSLFGWLISYYTVHYLFGLVPEGIFRFALGIPVVIMALYIATLITAVLIKPLRPLFKNAQQQTIKYVAGQTAIVRTSRVNNSYGEATLEDGGAGLILKVRSFGDTEFKKGDRVVLLEYVETDNVYRVISEEESSGK